MPAASPWPWAPWVWRGLLTYRDGPGSGLDAARLHEVIALTDNALLESHDLRVSLEQMRRGEGIPTDVDELARELGIDG